MVKLNALELLEKKLAELKTKDSTNEQIKNDLKTKLDTVRLIKKLMDDMGLSFDDNSKNKIIGWEKEYRNL
jgi:DNA-directed RNA polymerase sigma subunit (sigma70/sigma32)